MRLSRFCTAMRPAGASTNEKAGTERRTLAIDEASTPKRRTTRRAEIGERLRRFGGTIDYKGILKLFPGVVCLPVPFAPRSKIKMKKLTS